MKDTKPAALCLFFMLFFMPGRAQHLKPGFEKEEYAELVYIATRSSESPEKAKLIPFPQRAQLAYQSKAIGLDNLWELWIMDKSIAVICTRGSTATGESWLANLYAAMTPAKGEFKITKTDTFRYELSEDPNAAVHIGYLLSTAFIAKDLLPRVDSCYKAGIRDFLITGHSQGGGISYLLTAYLYSLQQQGRLASDIRFKTYCSAAPKPGNLYFAYSYENRTRNGWAFNVVNAADWVPRTPLSVQMPEDMPEVSPIPLIEGAIKQQSFFKRIFLNIIYGKLRNPSRKTVKNYQKLLGKEMEKRVSKYLPDFKAPPYYHSNDYVRTGNTIVLYPDAAYYKQFPNGSKDMMIHHSFPPYLYLLEKLQ